MLHGKKLKNIAIPAEKAKKYHHFWLHVSKKAHTAESKELTLSPCRRIFSVGFYIE
jgi:hypothetical protein